MQKDKLVKETLKKIKTEFSLVQKVIFKIFFKLNQLKSSLNKTFSIKKISVPNVV